ncbi:unnamed protein product, partial [Pylaiella littoralis]
MGSGWSEMERSPTICERPPCRARLWMPSTATETPHTIFASSRRPVGSWPWLWVSLPIPRRSRAWPQRRRFGTTSETSWASTSNTSRRTK